MRYVILLIISTIFALNDSASAKTVLTGSDITFDGGFMVNTIFSPLALTMKKINGEVIFYTLGGGNSGDAGALFSITPPSSSLGTGTDLGTYPVATSIRYGDIYQDKYPDKNLNNEATRVKGLFWDETDSRLYFLNTKDYDTTPDSTLSIGWATIDDTAHTGTAVGMWKISYVGMANGSYAYGDRWASGMVSIPEWFRPYVNGKRLGVGNGLVVSVLSAGPMSYGPVLYAMDPLSVTTQGSLMSPPNLTPLLAHQDGFYTKMPRGGASITDQLTTFSVGAGVGHVTDFDDNDETRENIWIDGVAKHGLLSFGTLRDGNVTATIQSTPTPTSTTFTLDSVSGLYAGDRIRVESTYVQTIYNYEAPYIQSIDGNEITLTSAMTGTPVPGGMVNAGRWYGPGGNYYTRLKNYIYIHNPDDLIDVASEVDPPGDVPAARYLLELPDGVGRRVIGSAYDHDAKKMYVAFYYGNGGQAIIMRYSVNGLGAQTSIAQTGKSVSIAQTGTHVSFQ